MLAACKATWKKSINRLPPEEPTTKLKMDSTWSHSQSIYIQGKHQALSHHFLSYPSEDLICSTWYKERFKEIYHNLPWLTMSYWSKPKSYGHLECIGRVIWLQSGVGALYPLRFAVSGLWEIAGQIAFGFTHLDSWLRLSHRVPWVPMTDPWDECIFTSYHKNQPFMAGKYTSPMDPMGLVLLG